MERARKALLKAVDRARATPARGLAFSLTLYPPRAAEAFSSWMILLWGIFVVGKGDIMIGPQFAVLLRAMTEDQWGWTAIIAASGSLAALVWNGHGRPTPALRLIGAIYRCMFWVLLSAGFYRAVSLGAQDFPMRGALLVPIAFELYASVWIGRDIVIHATKKFDAPRVPSRLAVRSGHG